jgi:hypothetical protein
MLPSTRIILAVVLTASPLAQAGAAATIIGAGPDSCAIWTADHQAARVGWVGDVEWVFGFLSGIGIGSSGAFDPLHGLDANAVVAWMDSYCLDHPFEQITDAGQAFVRAHPH